jgi:hypothetical protein
MEASPVDLGLAYNTPYDVAGTENGIGSGKNNTELIITALNQKGENGSAAQLCKAYTLNGYNDWFLPSAGELDLMYRNLKQRGLGNFGNYYWSSSESSNYYAYVQGFTSGNKSANFGKNNTALVRAVRTF